MRKFICWAMMLCLLLTSCAKATPQKAADGASWGEKWVTLGAVLGVEAPGNGLVLLDNNEALSIADMYLASWTIGEPVPYVNEDEDEVELYPARLDALVYGRKDEEAARQALEDWSVRQAETYNVIDTQKEDHNGQSYTISTYTCKSDSNPYSRGTSAFGVYKDYAISVELNCQEDFAGDEAEILRTFLDGCHFAA